MKDNIDELDNDEELISYNHDDDEENEDEELDNDEIVDIIDDDEDFEIISSIPENKEIVEEKKKRGPKPKLFGKHSLSYDSIFKGSKKSNQIDEFDCEHIIKDAGGSLDINDNIIDIEEVKSSTDYYRDIQLKNEIRKILENYTLINFSAVRRKPSKTDFNAYYKMLIKDLSHFGYTYTEIFIELAYYFTDKNIWNIFKLLDTDYANIIMNELKEKFGLSDIDKVDFI